MHNGQIPVSALEIVALVRAPQLVAPGSFVRLNSGGPVGLVQALFSDDTVDVLWFDADHTRASLPEACVSLIVG